MLTLFGDNLKLFISGDSLKDDFIFGLSNNFDPQINKTLKHDLWSI